MDSGERVRWTEMLQQYRTFHSFVLTTSLSLSLSTGLCRVSHVTSYLADNCQLVADTHVR